MIQSDESHVIVYFDLLFCAVFVSDNLAPDRESESHYHSDNKIERTVLYVQYSQGTNVTRASDALTQYDDSPIKRRAATAVLIQLRYMLTIRTAMVCCHKK